MPGYFSQPLYVLPPVVIWKMRDRRVWFFFLPCYIKNTGITLLIHMCKRISVAPPPPPSYPQIEKIVNQTRCSTSLPYALKLCNKGVKVLWSTLAKRGWKKMILNPGRKCIKVIFLHSTYHGASKIKHFYWFTVCQSFREEEKKSWSSQ